MGYIDLKMDIATGPKWRPRNLRMQSLKNSSNFPDKGTSETNKNNGASTSGSSSSCNNTDDNEYQNMMVLDLYLAAKTGDADALIDVIERVSTEKKIPPLDLLEQTSPARNTLLHLCMIYGNKQCAAFIAYNYPPLLAKTNSRGDTVLHLAARRGDWELVEALTYPPGPETRNLCALRNEEGNTPLHESLIEKCREDVLNHLIVFHVEVLHFVNNKGESPLYLASKAGNVRIVRKILSSDRLHMEGRFSGKSAIHAAILYRQQGVLKILLAHQPSFILLRDEEGKTPLHLAASLGYLEEAKYLLGVSSDSIFIRDNDGLLPIHIASIKGYKNLVDLLLQYWPESCELLSSKGQNILHVAVESGSNNMVSFILGAKKFEKLINMKDQDGNTPLHIAAMSWHPKTVSILTWDKRVDSKLKNNQGKTALDCAEHHMESLPSFQMRLTWAALKSGGVPQGYSKSIIKTRGIQHPTHSNKSDMERYKDRVNTLLLVATIVATITFAAGFTMPGGYNNSDPDQGMATMLKNKWFQVFIFCDTIAMYSSIIVSVALIWAQLGDLNLVLTAFRVALPLLGVSLSMMSLSFVAGVYLVVSKLRWLAISILVTGFILLIVLGTLFLFLCFPLSSNRRVIRHITYYPFCLLTFVCKNYN